MNKAQRAPWVALTESGYVLCSFCRHGDPKESLDHPCAHPLEAVSESGVDAYGMEPLTDCWGFRPGPGDTVAAAAIRLQEWQAEDAAREGDL